MLQIQAILKFCFKPFTSYFKATMFSSIFLFQLLNTTQKLEQCGKRLQVGPNQIAFCQKLKQFNSMAVKAQLRAEISHFFVHSDISQNSVVQLTLNHLDSFAVFGFSHSQRISNCTVNVMVDYSVVSAALVCLQCDLVVDDAKLIFIASGSYLAGLVMTARDTIVIQRSQVQVRLDSSAAAGIVNKIQTAMTSFTLLDSTLTAYFWQSNFNNGYLSSSVQAPLLMAEDPIQIIMANFTACANANDFGTNSKPVTVTSPEPDFEKCESICGSTLYYTYGLCLSGLELGILSAFKLECSNDFQFDGTKCSCKDGFLLDGTACMNVVGKINGINSQLQRAIKFVNDSLSNGTSDLNQKVDSYTKLLEERILSNRSYLEGQMVLNASAADSNLLRNSSYLAQMLVANNTQIQGKIAGSIADIKTLMNKTYNDTEQHIVDSFAKMDTNLALNLSVLKNRIIDNNNQGEANLLLKSQYVEQKITGNYTLADSNLNASTNILDARLMSNYTATLDLINFAELEFQSKVQQAQYEILNQMQLLLDTVEGLYVKIVDYIKA
ncbi:Hypothetical_protein [Hexamita inflata]|uniref:Hypothetical_protein n=1 Tax=Hexamita inflata TaxID=28002 RepID=A0AA86PAA7_9EUKA|nr:Hypothetical protein HINF_LOCUS22505 [Hexamita inflata]CAI9934867.1 Hypothetical protein HINF_LOCUS22512 [Hexamita inflata]